MTTVTWLHLSDWHQRGAEFDRRVIRDALVQDIGKRRDRISPDLSHVDFIVFSGDVAYSGKEEEYAAAAEYLLEPVLEATQLERQHVILVPGNHDVDRDRFKLLPEAVSRPFTAENQVQEWLQDPEKRSELLKPFKAYGEFATNFNGQEQPAYTTLRKFQIDEVTVALLGLNSALMCGRNKDTMGAVRDRDYLIVGEHQIYDALQEIEDANIKIAVQHHPHDYLTEFDRERVRTRLLDRCDFILHGHEHRPRVEEVRSTQGKCIVVPCGASYTGRVASDPRYQLAYNFMHLDLPTGKGVAYLRRWSDTRGEFIEDFETLANGQYPFAFAPESESFAASLDASSAATAFRVTGVAYDKKGHPKQDVKVQIVAGPDIYQGVTSENGQFDIAFNCRVDVLTLVAATVNDQPPLSTVRELKLNEVVRGEVRLFLKPESELSGVLRWCGSGQPIADAEVSVELPSGELRRTISSSLGRFGLELPDHYSYDLSVRVVGGVETSLQVSMNEQTSVEVMIARSCQDAFHETLLVQRVCDDIEISFVLVPQGTFWMGPPEQASEIQTDSFWIARYPITCLQYSFYLQHNPDVPLPLGWSNRLPPSGKEQHPVAGTTWYDASNFCEWLSALVGHKFCLPSEAQWEKAARGGDRRRFPWGDEYSLQKKACNSGGDWLNESTSVDKYPLSRSPFGAWDMIGNVWEWTSSRTQEHAEVTHSSDNTPRVARGGSYLDIEESVTCFSRENFPSLKRLPQLGFRIVREA